jgi:hypothetical protein
MSTRSTLAVTSAPSSSSIRSKPTGVDHGIDHQRFLSRQDSELPRGPVGPDRIVGEQIEQDVVSTSGTSVVLAAQHGHQFVGDQLRGGGAADLLEPAGA